MSPTDYPELIERIWHGALTASELLQHGEAFSSLEQKPLAIAMYQTWLAHHPAASSTPYIWFNLGVARFECGDFQGAIQCYETALATAPNLLSARFNLGLMYERFGRYDEAVAQWQEIEERADPSQPEQLETLLQALNNRGRLQEDRRKYGDAYDSLCRSLLLDPEQPDVLHHWNFVRARQCLWPIYAPFGQVRVELMRESTSALAMLSFTDAPEAQLAAALNYSKRKLPKDLPRLSPDTRYQHQRLRIGYCSSDFCKHPVAMLTVELFELHDRTRFEVFAYCWSREDGSNLRRRIKDAADHFIPIHHLDDAQAAQRIRDDEIDILIDLQGQTSGARPPLIARHPAPIQITYLGLPATTGLPGVDYMLADRFLIPEEYTQWYSEQMLYLPDIYQVSDRKRLCAPPPTRHSCGLPEQGFVFCAFNNSYKVTPEMFNAWINIVQRVPGSVLWLLADNEWAEQNLRREAQARGLVPERLIFNHRDEPEVYLSRYALADLFLDTYPFNGGTTVNDALFMAVPVLTISGRSFAARMAGALLTAAGLPQLITKNHREYEEKAVALATSPGAVSRLREHLTGVRSYGALFDTPRFVKNLEEILLKL